MKHIFPTLAILWCVLTLVTCTSSNKEQTKKNQPASNLPNLKKSSPIAKPVLVERKGLDQLIDIQKINPTIQVDLKYASEDNFMHRKLYLDISHAYLQKEVAIRLSTCQKYLQKIQPELSLLVYDGVRPLSVQQAMWDALDTIPLRERTKFVSNPANGSLHNYGAAVDLTICNLYGKAIDMGARYDDIREIAYPKLESYFLQKGELTEIQVANRKLLRKVMRAGGFTPIETEWWHFNACSRAKAKQKFEILR